MNNLRWFPDDLILNVKLLTSASGATGCQDGWESFKDKCFLFSEDQKSWSDAESHCKSLGAQLAELKDFDTNEFAKHFLNLKYLFHDEQTRHNFFIGLSDQDHTSVWKWAGSGKTADFTDWTSGEPSGGTEHCTVLWGYIGYWWNDEECQKNSISISCVFLNGISAFWFNNAIRLVGGQYPWEGRVEVKHNGQWGTICDDFFDINDTTVVCRMLGYNDTDGSVKYYGSSYFGRGYGPILIDDLDCSGEEDDVSECNRTDWFKNNCGHDEDVSVNCGVDIPIVRLVNGKSSLEGRVEINANGSWGTICDDSFGVQEANVICGMLGYAKAGSVHYSGAHFGSGDGPIVLDDLNCRGTETNILDCQSRGLFQHNCGHGEDAGVACNGPTTEVPSNISTPNCYISIVGDPVNVWIVGSSIVKHAFVAARDRPGGVNLDLGRLNASLWWQGKGGMIVKHVKSQLRTMKKYEDPPHFLILHVAGNDIGSSRVGFLRNEIQNVIRWIMKEFPNSKLVWSQILTRLKWRHSDDRKAMDLCRYRINNSIAAFIINCAGYYIKYPDIRADQKFFQPDGVHLSPLRNELWLNILQGAMEHFILKKDCASTFPC
ncbi:Neurotrypsin,Scavenger receptor cysteine-rich type 1 protein M130,Deleted in malignant brain tumors 1 protein,Scavenger receptor cysteine-rich domain-containing group B protein,Soluble scavenger receptor cysteine-rich domain-containing protein SSC5D [Mytilus coruscus]|uniref:Scavenger receptor cysteine-rich type 1 protein M130-like n=1 Tax=Mytilus coruscus TaxID=42192 RepID=A0A6J8CV90_MYTCO|nr:Neurotrypsin,Scavenger receptor cysteine-rich type 1 protein M130,Deleted in malignant brain tumors 1 protein,Scavenger receptor cysteine-rich domain-containing group B protein,Soluble scavenger receptor cysteine-rich domain-containing protein SSC5D [Mytilus coruscus]